MHSLVREVISVVASNVASSQRLRLRILVNLLNLLPDVEDRFEAVIATFTYASESGQLNLIVEHTARIEEWCHKWNLSPEQQRKFYHTLSNVFDKAHNSERAYHYLTKFLETFNTASKAEIAAVKEDTIKLLTAAIKLPLIRIAQRAHVSRLAAVQQVRTPAIKTMPSVDLQALLTRLRFLRP